jgi:hypothetical protein
MSGIPVEVSERMRKVLEESVENVVAGSKILVKRHVWRNPDYVGMVGEKVAVWEGWSANLRKLDTRYRTLYIDYVASIGSTKENERLFGAMFSAKIASIQPFIFLFVTACPLKTQLEIIQKGFTFRQINCVLHPGVLTSVNGFLETSLADWVSIGIELLYLQRRLRN